MGQLLSCLAACIYLREDFAFVALIPTYAKLISPCFVLSDSELWYVDMRRRQDRLSSPVENYQIGGDLPKLKTGIYTISVKIYFTSLPTKQRPGTSCIILFVYLHLRNAS